MRGAGALVERLGEFALVAAPKILGGVLMVGLNLILVRVLGVEAFGVFGLCMAAIVLADAVIGGPLDLAALRLGGRPVCSDDHDGSAVERAALGLKLGVAIAGGVLATLITAWCVEGLPALQGAWRPVALSATAVAALLFLRSVLVHLQLRRRFVAYGAIDLAHVALKFGAIGALLAASTPGVATLLALWGMGPLIAAVCGGALAARPLLAIMRVPAPAIVALRSFAGWYVIAVALGAVIGRLDVITLGLLAPIEQAGLFAAAHAIAVIPEMLGTYVAVVLTPRLRAAAADGSLAHLHARVLAAIVAIALPGFVLALAVWDRVAALILPPAYLSSATIALVLLPGTLVAMATIPLALPIVMFWRPSLVPRMDVLLLPALMALYAVVVPLQGALGAAWLTMIVCLARSAVVQFVAWRLANDPQVRGEARAV